MGAVSCGVKVIRGVRRKGIYAPVSGSFGTETISRGERRFDAGHFERKGSGTLCGVKVIVGGRRMSMGRSSLWEMGDVRELRGGQSETGGDIQ
jgi:hypothetical protein